MPGCRFFTLANFGFQRVQALLNFGGRVALQMRQVIVLIQRDILDGPGVGGKKNDAGEFTVAGRNAWRGITAQAVPQNVDPIGGYFRLLPHYADGAHRILHRFLIQGESHVAHLVAVGERALVVAQHRNTARTQAFGEVAKNAVRVNLLVAIVRTWAMHQHYAGDAPLANRHSEGSAQFPFVRSDGHVALGECFRVAISGSLPNLG